MRNLFMAEIIIETRSYTSQTSGEEVKTSCHSKEKSKSICTEGIRKNIISYYSFAFTINSTTTTPNCTFS